jgi:hypothetical protein
MRKRLYANASPPGRDLANKELLNEHLKEPYNNSIDNSLRATKSIASKSIEQQQVLQTMLRRMDPAYKRGKAESMADPLAHRIKKVMGLLRQKLSTDNFIEAAKHLDSLSPLDQIQFCENIEKLYRSGGEG